MDYSRESKITRDFFAIVQNKMHYAVHGNTAAELITARADHRKDHMGLTSWKNAPSAKIVKADVSIAKNYLLHDEMQELNEIVTMYLDYAIRQARRRIPMTMADWAGKLDAFLKFNDAEILQDKGRVSTEIAKAFAENEFEQYRMMQDREGKIMKICRTATDNFPEQIHEIFIDEGKQGLYDYILQLLDTGFFPFDRPQSMWILMCDGKEAFLLHSSKSITSYGSYGSQKPDDLIALQAIYFKNVDARAEYLFKEYGGVGIEMYFSGRWSEYQDYQISIQVEEQWAKKRGISLVNNQEAVNNNVHEAYDFLSLIMKRPGMFVGGNQLDLAKVYFDGWRHHQRCMWDISYDMECWLFRTEGVSFTGGILAWSLFYAYFGAEDTGVNKFRDFLANTIPTSYIALQIPASITNQIGSVLYSFERKNREFYGLTEYCDFCMDKEGITEELVATEVLRLVRRLLPELPNQIKIYINKRSLYCHVRIFFCQDGVWNDGIDVFTGTEDTKQLVVLHAFLHNAIDWYNNQIMIITSKDEHTRWQVIPYEAPHHPYVCNHAQEELLMYHQFEHWYKEQKWR